MIEKEKIMIIMGNVEEVKKIIESLIERYGGETKIIDILKKFNKDKLILV